MGVLAVVMLTHIILAADLAPLSKVTVVHHSHPVHQCILRRPVGNQTVLVHPILTAMVDEHRPGMLLHTHLILMAMEEGRQHGLLVPGHLTLMRQDQMWVLLAAVLAQVGAAPPPPDLVVGRHQQELHRPLLPLHLHGVHLSHGVLLRERRRLHGNPVG